MPANQSTKLKDYDPNLRLDVSFAIQTLENASNEFVKGSNDSIEIWAASRDWFLEQWGRDTFIALPGLLLARGRYDEAKEIFSNFAQHEKNGLIPNVIRPEEKLYNTVDASLWYVNSLYDYLKFTDDWIFVENLLPTINKIIKNYIDGTGYIKNEQEYKIYMDSDGLIVSPSQSTWMDADPSGNGTQAVTPRQGKCIEINALWFRSLEIAIDLNKKSEKETVQLDDILQRINQSFKKFWNEQANCLYDYIDGDDFGSEIRPNQLLAITKAGKLLSLRQKKQILSVVKNNLLTLGGLRTLSPKSPSYIGEYNTYDPIPVKDLAYHQGTVWPWLIGAYCDALYDIGLQDKISEVVQPLARFCIESEFKSIPEVFSGDTLEPGGTTSQAWSVAEVLRILKKYQIVW